MSTRRSFYPKLVPALLAVVLVACAQVELGAPSATSQPEELDHPSVLTGSEWILTRLHGRPLIEDTRITLAFDVDEFRGFASCNQYWGPYQVDGDTITITELEATVVGCDEPHGGIGQENRYHSALMGSNHFQMTDDHLELLDSNGKVALAFDAEEGERDLSLEGHIWSLEKWFGGEPFWAELIPGTTITIQFQDGVVRGNAGCNQYEGSYTTYGYTLRINDLHWDGGTCTEPDGVMEQEADYLNRLQQVGWVRIEGRELILNGLGLGPLSYKATEEAD